MMKQRSVGRTGLQVSELGFGAGGFWGMSMFDEALARNLVDIALDHGINFFDTGPNYSGGNAEPRLGKILGARRDKVLIGTKCGTHLVGGRHLKDYSPAALRASFDVSRKRLGRDHLDLLQLHGMPRPIEDGTLQFLADLKHRGEVRALGVSGDAEDVAQIISAGIFDVAMIEYNVIKRYPQEQLIERCGEAGIGVMLKSPLAQTLYSSDIFKVRRLADIWYLLRALKNHRHKIRAGWKYRFLNQYPDTSAHALALQFVLANPHVSCAIIGTTKPEHLLQNIQAARTPIPDEILARIRAV